MDIKDVPGTVGMILRGEISRKCDLCGNDTANSRNPIEIQNPLQMAMLREIYARLGKPNWQPNPENKIPVSNHCPVCIKKYMAEVAKLRTEINKCWICGETSSEFGFVEFLNPNWYSQETLAQIFRILGKGAYIYNPYSHPFFKQVSFLAFCQSCVKKFYVAEVQALKKQNPEQ